jgi:VWFA-related protein
MFALLFGSSPALPQATAPASEATIQVTSRIVYVDIVVRDSNGHIVRGLTENDFHLAENGKTQKIDYFRDHTRDEATSAAETGARDPLSFSNVAQGSDGLSSVNIILFDFFNTAPQDYTYARKQMIRFLQELPPGRQTALFVLGTQLKMVQSFTASTDRLVAAAKAIQLETSAVETTSEQQQDIALGQAFAKAVGRSASGKNPVDEQNDMAHGQDETRAYGVTKIALDQIGAAVSGYPGRKNLYWLGETFPLYGGPVLELHDASQAVLGNRMSTQDEADANKAEATAQIAIYPISLTGLEAGDIGAESSVDPQNGRELARQFNQRSAMHEMLNRLADTTGGHAYYGTNDFAGALARGFEDGASYYSLAYRPENHNWNGHYRNISVKLGAHGYSLSYRRGYYATPDQTATHAGAERVMTELLQPDTPQATALRLKSTVSLPDAAHHAVRVESVIDPGNVEFVTDAKGRRQARLMVTLEALPDPLPSNAAPGAATKPPQVSGLYVVDVDEAAFRKVLTDGMPAHQQITLPPGHYRLRLGVCDLANLHVGTLDMPVTVE